MSSTSVTSSGHVEEDSPHSTSSSREILENETVVTCLISAYREIIKIDDNESQEEQLTECLKEFVSALKNAFRFILQVLNERSCETEVLISFDRLYQVYCTCMESTLFRTHIDFVVNTVTKLLSIVFNYPTEPLNIENECSRRLKEHAKRLLEDSDNSNNTQSGSSCSYSSKEEERAERLCHRNPYVVSPHTRNKPPSLSSIWTEGNAIPLKLHDTLIKVSSSVPTSITIASPFGIVNFIAENPFRMSEAEFLLEGVSCDTCMGRHLTCGYRAVFGMSEDDLSAECHHTGEFIEGRQGFDLCVACAAFFYSQQLFYLQRCLRPPYCSFQVDCASVKILKTRVETVSPRVSRLLLRCALSPLGSVPIAWDVGKKECCTETEAAREVFCAPPSQWRDDLKVQSLYEEQIKESLGKDWAEQCCPICMNPLSTGPVVASSCHHVFHVSCIQDVFVTRSVICPLCRLEDTFPPLSGVEVLKINIFDLEVEIHDEVGDADRIVFIGTLLKEPFLNATNIAAGTIIKI